MSFFESQPFVFSPTLQPPSLVLRPLSFPPTPIFPSDPCLSLRSLSCPPAPCLSLRSLSCPPAPIFPSGPCLSLPPLSCPPAPIFPSHHCLVFRPLPTRSQLIYLFRPALFISQLPRTYHVSAFSINGWGRRRNSESLRVVGSK